VDGHESTEPSTESVSEQEPLPLVSFACSLPAAKMFDEPPPGALMTLMYRSGQEGRKGEKKKKRKAG